MEASRKHGSFDTRWPCVRRDGASVVPDVSRGVAEAEELDWDAFSAQHVVARGRLSLVPTEPASAGAEADPEEPGTLRLLAAVAAVDRREPTGG